MQRGDWRDLGSASPVDRRSLKGTKKVEVPRLMSSKLDHFHRMIPKLQPSMVCCVGGGALKSSGIQEKHRAGAGLGIAWLQRQGRERGLTEQFMTQESTGEPPPRESLLGVRECF